jgi:antitoxin YefM
MITRKRNHAVIMISLDEYHSLEETAHLLRTPANARRLTEAILQVENSKTVRKKPSDLASG